MVVKAAGGAICIGLVVTGIVGLADPGALGMMPRYTTLSQDQDYLSKNSDKYGATHKDKLVGATGNKKWWEWSFKRLQADQLRTGEFAVVGEGNSKRVGSAYSETAPNKSTYPKALNRVCENAYKSAHNKITETGNGTDEYNEGDFWKYCSWLGKKPKQAATQSQ